MSDSAREHHATSFEPSSYTMLQWVLPPELAPDAAQETAALRRLESSPPALSSDSESSGRFGRGSITPRRGHPPYRELAGHDGRDRPGQPTLPNRLSVF